MRVTRVERLVTPNRFDSLNAHERERERRRDIHKSKTAEERGNGVVRGKERARR